jgi:DGQHR domain-containing protein
MAASHLVKAAPTIGPLAYGPTGELHLPALEVRQGSDRVLYAFAVDGKLLPRFAAISRIGRDGEKRILGYQRPEVLSHIAEIRTYLESHQPMIPNAIVLAFDRTVRFEAADDATAVDYARPGTLIIPDGVDRPEDGKAAWVVDGQQRLAAIREARIDRFPMCAIGFIASGNQEQREQFILVNNTKPLPKGLIYELLPTTEACLPTMLQKRRFPASLLDRLNLDDDSPLRGMVRTPTMMTGVIKDNSLIKMLENSLSDGALYRFRGPDGAAGDVEGMLRVVKHFWEAVREVFRPAWHLPPRQSRLMHGAGVVALGFVMDAIADRHREAPIAPVESFFANLEPLRAVCRWTDGYWDFGPGMRRRWNEIQNTPKDIQLLANYLLVQYKELVWDRTR